jgi:predicted regulator of Ras-like GTPase activity (Roadblock/LC7/MglB family)
VDHRKPTAARPVAPDDYRRILERMVADSGAITALLVTKEGNAVTKAGDTSYFDVSAMAALVAGMFSATREVARMVGESQFSILLQQGQNRHIHVSLVTDALMMVVVFEDYQRIGRVRHEAKKACDTLMLAMAAQRRERREPEPLQIPQFKEFALNVIDRIFTTK